MTMRWVKIATSLLVLAIISNHVCQGDSIQKDLEQILQQMQDASISREGSMKDRTATPKDDDAIWAEIGQLRDAIIALEESDKFQQQQIDVIKEDVDGMDTELRQVKTQTETLEDLGAEHKIKLEKIEEQAVGFTAYAKDYASYPREAVIKFEAIHSNRGNHYNAQDGIFTCPYHGMYHLSATVSPAPSTDETAILVLEGKEIMPLVMMSWLGDPRYAIYKTTSASVTLECKAGEKIWVKSTSALLGVYGVENDYSMFAAALLNRLDI